MHLINVVETENLLKSESGVSSNNNLDLKGDEPVSMNMWGFTPVIFDYLNSMFEKFLLNNINDDKSEFLIPSVINDLINSGCIFPIFSCSGASSFKNPLHPIRKIIGISYN